MKYIDADQIRAEIERRKKENMYVDLPMSIGRYYEDRDILAFLDTLQEQPVLPGIDEEGIPGKDFIPVEWVDACERYGKWKIVSAEQPVEGLEEEYARFAKTDHHQYQILLGNSGIDLARHFAAWQKAKMMKEAVNGRVYRINGNNVIEKLIVSQKFQDGDKVRVIVIKEDKL